MNTDVKTATKWFEKAALQGNADGQYLMGLAHEHGKGTEKNLAEATKWYTLSAAQGHEGATKKLASTKKSK